MPEEHAWIEMDDGIRLAATLYLPASEPPWPVVIEALPYRKDDVTSSYGAEYRRLRDEGNLAVARIDVRGTGSSEGIAIDEYPAREQQDMCEAIAWLAARPWSNGAVGMYGTSYSGFNSIQVAMERPEALKAIIAIYATDDRYTDDVHYQGGAKRGLDSIDYPLYMVAMNALPPVPSIAGEGWRDQWAERVEKLEPWLLRWLDEQDDGPYWRHGSLRPDYGRITCATMIVAGWADGYRNATFRAFEELTQPKRLLFGPWSHASAETALPGPHIDLVPEMIRWWDRWLRDEPNGVDDEPPITLFARRSTKLEPDLEEVRGEWRYEPGWPLERAQTIRLQLADSQVPSGSTDSLDIRGDVGVTASISCAGHLPFGQPFDQRPDEAHSLVYDFETLDEELEILGYPTLDATVSASAPVAFLSAKLCDVFEDGTSILVSRGFLNLTHRESLSQPQPLEPGRAYRVTVELDVTSWTFEAG
ncbi:MAG: CocE/NonD family hydrolase, partial [Actinomycetota bacterium]|nr:CocE/NonD family hydrolase [Actinomycetota bacterium]